MPDNIDPFAAPMSRRRPLLGVTLLLVEDSRFCSEAVRLMSLRTGARLRRADSLRSARKHLSMYRPDLMLVDLGLPDGSGLDLIAEVVGQQGEPPAIIAMSGDVTDTVRSAVQAAGANGFLPKPIGNIKYFQQLIEATLSSVGTVPGFAPQSVDVVPELDHQALHDDLGRIHAILQDALPKGDKMRMQYCAQFVTSVAQTARDTELMHEARQFFERMDTGGTGERSGKTMLALLQEKLKVDGKAIANAREMDSRNTGKLRRTGNG